MSVKSLSCCFKIMPFYIAKFGVVLADATRTTDCLVVVNMLTIFDTPYGDPYLLPLAAGPGPIFTILSAYLLFVLKLGPAFMANRKPYELRGALKVYNLIQVLYNSLTLAVCMYSVLQTKEYNFSCLMPLPLDHENKSLDRMFHYAYYLNKILDLTDTIFFVLRKSYKQITLLHLIHHTLMPLLTYILIRIFGYGGHVIVVGILNVVVHMVMYSYYFISASSSTVKHSLWWKQYITIMQMLQFILMFCHSVWTLWTPNCNVNRPTVYLILAVSALMFVMFVNFFIHAYVMTKGKKVEDAKLK